MTADAAAKLSPQEFIDQHPMSRRQWLIVILCLLTMVAEGLDTTVAAFVYPKLKDNWGTEDRTVTAIVTLSVLAMIIGGIAAGPLADRYGRKRVTVIGVAVFGLGTACMGFASVIGVLAGLRFVACLGLGAVLPTTMALVADWTPAKRRAQMITLAFAGVTAGTTVGGVLASVLIPAFGWPTLLVVCGIIPLLVIPAVVVFVPESVSLLAARERPTAELHRALAAVASDQDLSCVAGDRTTVQRGSRPAPRIVLSRDFAPTTLLLWLCLFLGQGIAYLIITYLPRLVEDAGLTDAQAALGVAAFGWGGLTGQLSVSFALKRFDRFRLLATLWGASAFGLAAAALWAERFTALLATAFAIGLCLPAATSVLQAITAVAYPQSVRATGISWANSAGKLGPVFGGLLGGLMVDADWRLHTVLLVLVGPVAIGLLATLTLRARTRSQRGEPSGPRPMTAFAPRQS
ncbi:aromatic acid/H+ symport family MFS transporter [Streptomyces pseudovenezuelae]|uniref:MFS transporter n=1 Tax=Streptomyces pseudovenezuelae TaxID=67350 RepID=UPI0034A4DFB6